MRLIDADELIKDRVENDPVRIAAMCAPTLHSGVIPQKSQESPDGKRLREREEFFEER